MDFAHFFKTSTGGSTPYDYQCRLASGDQARCEKPETPPGATICRSQLINIPTGLGKTAAVVLAWLWNRVAHPNPVHRANWPRRLVYCLPMRTLVEQTEKEVRKWLNAHELQWDDKAETRKGKVGVHVLMGGEDDGEWDIYPEENAILIGTQDMLLSRALNRGYGMSRYRWPMHFALLNNDALWVLDETQLMGVGVETSAQLDGFRHNAKIPTFGLCPTWWMSATLDSSRLATVDHPPPPDGWPSIRLEKDDLSRDDVKARVRARKNLAQSDITLSASTKNNYAKQLAEWVSKQHQPDSLTLIVANNVARAQEVYSQLDRLKLADPIGLIHSRFRRDDRRKHEDLLHSRCGRIVVATQAVEAGVDVSARTLITELAPWSSLVQRFGRCNRRGEFKGSEARVFWINIEIKDEKDALASPYEAEELALARKALKTLEDAGPESLQGVGVIERRLIRPVIRRKDIVELFDTTPDLAGHDLDISRYIRDGDDTDVQVFWRVVPDKPPSPEIPRPTRAELCRVSIARFHEFLKRLNDTDDDRYAWIWNARDSLWEQARSARAGTTYLLDHRVGGYVSDFGWTGKLAGLKPAEWVTSLLPSDDPPEAYDREETNVARPWLTLAEHTRHVQQTTETVASELLTGAAQKAWANPLKTAAQWHDVGKAHQVFQGLMTRRGAPSGAQQVWAKSGSALRTDRFLRKHFRHELASALAWLQAGPPNTPERDLIAYLIAAHHGKVRLSIRSLPTESAPDLPPTPDGTQRLFARGIWHQHKDDSEQHDVLPPVMLNGITTPKILIDLSVMQMGEGPLGSSWLARMLALRDRADLGPFRLAYLETLLRAADMRASAAESNFREGES
jgi:CRISPR-associated endonuclease/helicase Cas3